jgi:hypothetical protein
MKIKSLIPVFCKWLNENKARFLVKPEIANINKKQANVKVIFPAIPMNILTVDFRCRKRCISICIAVEKDGVIWDFILDFDSNISKIESGYICNFCMGEKTVYPTLEAFAIGHTFEFFLTWCNENIATAQGLALYGNADKKECSWAKLIPIKENLSESKPTYYFPFDFADNSCGH